MRHLTNSVRLVGVIGMCVFVTGSVHTETIWQIVDLTPGVAFGINEKSQVVGRTPDGAFIWDSEKGLQNLGTLPGGTAGNTIAFAINKRGEVVGTSNDRAFIWDELNGMRDLGLLPGGTFAQAYGINDDGVVVGQSGIPNGVDTRAFIWDQSNGMHELPGDLPGGSAFSQAFAVSNKSQVVGGSVGISAAGILGERAVVWESASEITDLGDLPFGNDFSVGRGVNHKGQVVGSDGTRVFLWDPRDGMLDIGSGRGWAINDRAEIVGDDDVSAAFRWTPKTGRVSLPIRFAFDINNAGQIVGSSGDHAVLLIEQRTKH